MKTLQNNFTTPEQSKRLLDLGVPADSADCVRVVRTDMVFFMQHGKVTKDYLNLYKSARCEEAEPCWSVGRLINIYCTIIGRPKVVLYSTDIYTDAMVGLIDAAVQRGFDFSKLEE